MHFLNKKLLYPVASFFAGFSVMTVELISSRIVAPIIGSSVYTWTSVIGVTLLGLSIGSWIGGKIADKDDGKKFLSFSFLISAVLVFIIPVLSKNTSFLVDSFDSILWLNILVSLYLFLLPAISIGTIQPLILKNFSNDFSKLGTEYGLLSSLWSIGSVVGVFLTGFLFISSIGSSETIYLISGILFVIASFFLDVNKKNIQTIIVLVFLLLFFFFLFNKNTADSTTIFEKETNYYKLKVADAYIPNYGSSRLLFLDIDAHSIMPEKINYQFYPEIYPIFSQINENIKNILVIGAGAYTMPKYFKNYYTESKVSVIEVDPELKPVAEKYFNLDKYNIETINNDARVSLKKSNEKYDLIFGDAYNSFISVPWYLLTKEWNEIVKKRLNNNGIYAINFIGSFDGEESFFTKSVITTFKTTFPNYYIFGLDVNTKKTQNIILVGINAASTLSEKELVSKLKSKNIVFYKNIIPTEFFANSNSTILTDNFAPVEKLMTPIVKDYFPQNMAFIKAIKLNLYQDTTI